MCYNDYILESQPLLGAERSENMENTEKLNVYIPQEMKVQIQNDAMLFEIFKKNRREVNINRFLSLLLCGYHDDFLHENNESHHSILGILNGYNISSADQAAISDQILKEAILPTDDLYQSKKSIPLSLKPTAATKRVLLSIEGDLAGRDTMSQYIRRMLISYFQKATWKRERIIFHDSSEFLIDACQHKLPVSFTLIWKEKQIHEVIPYKLLPGSDGMFNYLICVECNRTTGKQEVRSYRLSRITMPGCSRSALTMSKELLALCKKTAEIAPQYAINSEVEICVKLSDAGEILYNRIYSSRPRYSRIEDREEGHYYYFQCSEDQIYHYFRRFDNATAVIIFPKTLVERMIRFHQGVIDAYEEVEGNV